MYFAHQDSTSLWGCTLLRMERRTCKCAHRKVHKTALHVCCAQRFAGVCISKEIQVGFCCSVSFAKEPYFVHKDLQRCVYVCAQRFAGVCVSKEIQIGFCCLVSFAKEPYFCTALLRKRPANMRRLLNCCLHIAPPLNSLETQIGLCRSVSCAKAPYFCMALLQKRPANMRRILIAPSLVAKATFYKSYLTFCIAKVCTLVFFYGQ